MLLHADYVFDQRKFGGNAQSITGKRWLHHTSFLWDYRPEAMALLKHPPRSPKYREVRSSDRSTEAASLLGGTVLLNTPQMMTFVCGYVMFVSMSPVLVVKPHR